MRILPNRYCEPISLCRISHCVEPPPNWCFIRCKGRLLQRTEWIFCPSLCIEDWPWHPNHSPRTTHTAVQCSFPFFLHVCAQQFLVSRLHNTPVLLAGVVCSPRHHNSSSSFPGQSPGTVILTVLGFGGGKATCGSSKCRIWVLFSPIAINVNYRGKI